MFICLDILVLQHKYVNNDDDNTEMPSQKCSALDSVLVSTYIRKCLVDHSYKRYLSSEYSARFHFCLI